ncbi:MULTISPECIES: DUF2390 domain-containing protein [Marinobacter]|jgi:uncharacterized protein (TIGR02444 family)|uniref:TIGR02444 family protein n=3 Tax=Marinobacter TaxID=2742 RepID=A0A455W6N6_MARNT|nr:DUF2390 domain-containing protein [Marinobacter shengliensis]MCD1629379.1 DUF2390 domain-containing protein [Marinobacter shengliensis]WBU41752.1 DUF2390 domain-containing protein [Marinobacter alkaliphilus]BBJ02637.1 hypothetical protein YBY_04850 [Marinobacter nauticus]
MTVPQTESLNLPATMEPDNPLWRYALACWQNPELAEACLTLQACDWSVTRILCAGWLGVNGHLFTGVEDAKVTEWRSRVTGSIRSARKSIPRHHIGCRDLREALARAELQAEQTELALAWHTLTPRYPETGNMHNRKAAIQQNLLAAAPRREADTRGPISLDTLAGLLEAAAGELRP